MILLMLLVHYFRDFEYCYGLTQVIIHIFRISNCSDTRARLIRYFASRLFTLAGVIYR